MFLPWFLPFSQNSAVFIAIFCRDFLLSLIIGFQPIQELWKLDAVECTKIHWNRNGQKMSVWRVFNSAAWLPGDCLWGPYSITPWGNEAMAMAIGSGNLPLQIFILPATLTKLCHIKYGIPRSHHMRKMSTVGQNARWRLWSASEDFCLTGAI